MMMLGHLRVFKNHMIIIYFTFILFLLSSSSVLALRVNPLVELSTRDELVSVAGYGEERLSNVLVSGSVSCHPCFRGKLLRPRPISGASVVVSCHTNDGKKMKRNWGRGSTDEYGDFLIDIPSHLHAISNLESLCLVKLINLPKDSVCYNKYNRSPKVIKLSSMGNGIRTYTAQPIRITPHGCSTTSSARRET